MEIGVLEILRVDSNLYVVAPTAPPEKVLAFSLCKVIVFSIILTIMIMLAPILQVATTTNSG